MERSSSFRYGTLPDKNLSVLLQESSTEVQTAYFYATTLLVKKPLTMYRIGLRKSSNTPLRMSLFILSEIESTRKIWERFKSNLLSIIAKLTRLTNSLRLQPWPVSMLRMCFHWLQKSSTMQRKRPSLAMYRAPLVAQPRKPSPLLEQASNRHKKKEKTKKEVAVELHFVSLYRLNSLLISK